MAQSANVIKELRCKNRQFLEQQASWRKISTEKDRKIKELHKSLEDSKIKMKKLLEKLEAIHEDLLDMPVRPCL
jgi:hypothetical protein